MKKISNITFFTVFLAPLYMFTINDVSAQSLNCLTYTYYVSGSGQFISSSGELTIGKKTGVKRRACLPGEEVPANANFDKISYKDVKNSIKSASQRFGVKPNLIRSVIQVESGFSTQAVSKKGAKGLMQLLDATAAAYNVRDPFNPDANIHGGTQYLSDLIDQFQGDLEYALAAYNAGPEAVIKHAGIPPYAETEAYVKRVLYYYELAEKAEGGSDV